MYRVAPTTCAVSSCLVQHKPIVTDTLEPAQVVLAPPEHTQVVEHVALVDIDTGLLVSRRGVHEPHLAFTPEGSCKNINRQMNIGLYRILSYLHLKEPL